MHVEMASRLNAAADAMRLAELSALEQSLVFGEAGVKELIAYLTAAVGPTGCSPGDKLRLLFAFACMHPDKVRRIFSQGTRSQSFSQHHAQGRPRPVNMPYNKRMRGWPQALVTAL